MAGDRKNAQIWSEGDVLIGTLDAPIPQGAADFDLDFWSYVGFLSGEDGFTENIEIETGDHFAWGGHLIATSRSNFKLTRQFTAYEDNATVYDLVYPGHDVTFPGDGTYEGVVNVPDLQHQFKIAFQTRTGNILKRAISHEYAQVDERGEQQESETELSMRQLTVAIYPGDEDPVTRKRPLLYTFKGPINGNGPGDDDAPADDDS
jgi:hypothetical protein